MRCGFLAGACFVLSSMVVTAQNQGATVYDASIERGISQPILLKSVKPTYTPEARAARIQGMVLMETVVRSNGTVGDVKMVKPELWRYLGPAAKDAGPVTLLTTAEIARLGLDTQAVKAMKQWLFKPATKDGKPVAVRIRVELTFALGLK
jgi:outer membrane biosynthesis protein TonB